MQSGLLMSWGCKLKDLHIRGILTNFSKNSAIGKYATEGMNFAFGGDMTFNVLNVGDFLGKTKFKSASSGLLAVSIGRDGIGAELSTVRANVSVGNIASSMSGAKSAAKAARWKYGSKESRATLGAINSLGYVEDKRDAYERAKAKAEGRTYAKGKSLAEDLLSGALTGIEIIRPIK